MISTPWVKRRILDLLITRSTFETVSLLYSMPERESDLAGTDPVFRQSVGFDAPEGELRVDEMCGPTNQEYFEQYGMDVVIQVIGRNRDATPEMVEQRKAELIWELLQAIQDATLDLVNNPDSPDLISQLYVVAAEVLNVSGWLQSGGVNQAASRAHVQLVVDAKIVME